MEWPTPRHTDHWAHAAAIGGRGLSDTRGEQRAEAAETREAHFHADLGHRVLAGGEEALREVEARSLAELVWRDTEHRFELANQVKWRNPHVACEVLDGQRGLAPFEQQIAGAAQPAEAFVS